MDDNIIILLYEVLLENVVLIKYRPAEGTKTAENTCTVAGIESYREI